MTVPAFAVAGPDFTTLRSAAAATMLMLSKVVPTPLAVPMKPSSVPGPVGVTV